jgi:hypothetical protein
MIIGMSAAPGFGGKERFTSVSGEGDPLKRVSHSWESSRHKRSEIETFMLVRPCSMVDHMVTLSQRNRNHCSLAKFNINHRFNHHSAKNMT